MRGAPGKKNSLRDTAERVMYAGEDGEVCVELGYVGKDIASSKGNQPDKSKAGGWPVSSQPEILTGL